MNIRLTIDQGRRVGSEYDRWPPTVWRQAMATPMLPHATQSTSHHLHNNINHHLLSLLSLLSCVKRTRSALSCLCAHTFGCGCTRRRHCFRYTSSSTSLSSSTSNLYHKKIIITYLCWMLAMPQTLSIM